jgi:ABC-type transport system involved in multi-copper enzyme maturation permease subunit
MVGNVSFWLVYLFIPPLLTMRLFAEERSTGTLEMLLTAPVRDWQVVFAKYVACFGFYTLMWLPTLLYLPILSDWHVEVVQSDAVPWHLVTAYVGLAVALLALGLAFGVLFVSHLMDGRIASGCWFLFLTLSCLILAALPFIPIVLHGEWWTISSAIDAWPILTTYIGLALAGAMFLAIGMFVSSLVNSQMIAAIVSLFIGLLFIVGGIWQPEMDTSGTAYRVMFFFSVPQHFAQHFARGLIDTRHLVLYASVALYGVFLTVRSLESRRWQ